MNFEEMAAVLKLGVDVLPISKADGASYSSWNSVPQHPVPHPLDEPS